MTRFVVLHPSVTNVDATIQSVRHFIDGAALQLLNADRGIAHIPAVENHINPLDPQFAAAADLYRRAQSLEGLLKKVWARGELGLGIGGGNGMVGEANSACRKRTWGCGTMRGLTTRKRVRLQRIIVVCATVLGPEECTIISSGAVYAYSCEDSDEILQDTRQFFSNMVGQLLRSISSER